MEKPSKETMSFDIFLTCFHNGEAIAAIPRAIIETAFGPFVIKRDTGWWELEFPDGGQPTLYLDDAAMSAGFCINRPSGSPELEQALLDILRQSPSVLYWPGNGCVVADAAVIPHFPSNFIDDGGPRKATVITRPEEIGEAIRRG